MYIGVYEIKEEKSLPDDYTQVSFEPITKDDVSKEIPDEVFLNEVLAKVKTEEITDFNFVRDGRCELAAEKMLEVLLRYNLKTSELDYLIGLVNNSLQSSTDMADEKLWGTPHYNRTLRQIDEVLTS